MGASGSSSDEPPQPGGMQAAAATAVVAAGPFTCGAITPACREQPICEGAQVKVLRKSYEAFEFNVVSPLMGSALSATQKELVQRIVDEQCDLLSRGQKMLVNGREARVTLDATELALDVDGYEKLFLHRLTAVRLAATWVSFDATLHFEPVLKHITPKGNVGQVRYTHPATTFSFKELESRLHFALTAKVLRSLAPQHRSDLADLQREKKEETAGGAGKGHAGRKDSKQHRGSSKERRGSKGRASSDATDGGRRRSREKAGAGFGDAGIGRDWESPVAPQKPGSWSSYGATTPAGISYSPEVTPVIHRDLEAAWEDDQGSRGAARVAGWGTVASSGRSSGMPAAAVGASSSIQPGGLSAAERIANLRKARHGIEDASHPGAVGGYSAPPPTSGAEDATRAGESAAARVARLRAARGAAGTSGVGGVAAAAAAAPPGGGWQGDSGGGRPVCVVCLDQDSTHAFVPCGHRCICGRCSQSLPPDLQTRCPECRQPASSLIRIYGG